MTNPNTRAESRAPRESDRRVPTTSAVLSNGALLEMIYNRATSTTAFVSFKAGAWSVVPNHALSDGRVLVPFSPLNNLLTHDVVLFPSQPEEYGSKTELVDSIRAFIHRYVDLSPLFERIAAHYVLLSWVYDGFHELPYLRVTGAPGSGKTRFLLTLGSLCYKPIFASGASTVSPLFRILDSMKGTLVLDEADFRFSDEKSDVTKILNNGTVRGFPVLRAEQNATTKEFNPHAYHVFGPKLVASRGEFDDRGLESRFISERLGMQRLRRDVPISLGDEHREQALALRNRLLLFRLRTHATIHVPADLDRTIEPRLRQSFGPLLAVIDDPQVANEVVALARQYQRQVIADRGLDIDGQVLEVIRDLAKGRDESPTIKDITAAYSARHGHELQGKVTFNWIGAQIRKRLGLATMRRKSGYVIAPSEGPKLAALYERYGLGEALGNGAPDSPASPTRKEPGPGG
jgi:hypothetical protein